MCIGDTREAGRGITKVGQDFVGSSHVFIAGRALNRATGADEQQLKIIEEVDVPEDENQSAVRK